MKTPSQVLGDVERRLARTWTEAALGSDEGSWPHAFPLGQPTAAELAAGYAKVFQEVRAWRDWARQHDLVLTSRTRRVQGTDQDLPTHLNVPSAAVAASLVGGEWTARLARGRARAATLRERYPYLPDPAQTLSAVDRLGDVDFDLLQRAADWFAVNDATGLTPRQVPVEGLHAKWLNTRQDLVRQLAGVPSLGLLPPHPSRIHFTYLDPAHRSSGGRLHDSATVGDQVELAYLPRVVVISENKDTALHFPPLPEAVSVEGMGRGGSTAASFDWLVSASYVFYWGDMDADGLEILDGFRAAGVPATSVLMDGDSYDAWERFGTNQDVSGRPLTGREPRTTLHLTPDEAALYDRLVSPAWTRNRRVEQERIPLVVAHRAVCSHLER